MKKKRAHEKKKGGISGQEGFPRWKRRPELHRVTELPPSLLSFLHIYVRSDWLYIRGVRIIYTRRHLRSEQLLRRGQRKTEKIKQKNTARLPGTLREHGRGRPRQSRERWARWGTVNTSEHRMVDLTSSYQVCVIMLVYGSKAWRKKRLLDSSRNTSLMTMMISYTCIRVIPR